MLNLAADVAFIHVHYLVITYHNMLLDKEVFGYDFFRSGVVLGFFIPLQSYTCVLFLVIWDGWSCWCCIHTCPFLSNHMAFDCYQKTMFKLEQQSTSLNKKVFR